MSWFLDTGECLPPLIFEKRDVNKAVFFKQIDLISDTFEPRSRRSQVSEHGWRRDAVSSSCEHIVPAIVRSLYEQTYHSVISAYGGCWSVSFDV